MTERLLDLFGWFSSATVRTLRARARELRDRHGFNMKHYYRWRKAELARKVAECELTLLLSDASAYGDHETMLTNFSKHVRNEARIAILRELRNAADDVDCVVAITTPTYYRPVPGKRNVLFTMYEMDTLPDEWVPYLHEADLLMVPCEHNRRLFQSYTETPVVVCHEGMWPQHFGFYERARPKLTPFRFLWVGATNMRKGWHYVGEAWRAFVVRNYDLIQQHRVEIVFKTTQLSPVKAAVKVQVTRSPELNMDVTEEQEMPAERLVYVDKGNMWIDTRRLPISVENENPLDPGSMRAHYWGAHCFVLPSMGEGWGLPLNEAAATGCPVIYTPWSGPVDFLDQDIAYPLKWRYRTMKAVKPGKDAKTGQTANEVYHTGQVAEPDLQDVLDQMEHVYANYSEALERGRLASERMHERFTWPKAGATFLELLNRQWPGILGPEAEIEQAITTVR